MFHILWEVMTKRNISKLDTCTLMLANAKVLTILVIEFITNIILVVTYLWRSLGGALDNCKLWFEHGFNRY